MTSLIDLKKAERAKIWLRERKTVLDGTDSKRTNRRGCSWNVFDRISLIMTKRIL